jgi:hypothetical protein
MTALMLAKSRSARRHQEGGAVMFVVAMTVVVLASVGVFALAAAATEIKMSGNERQSTQTHYLAEYGVLGTAREMVATKAQLYLGLMLAQPDTCLSLSSVPNTAAPATRACRRLGSAELGTQWVVTPVNAYAGLVPNAAGIMPGSLGTTPLKADFFVELTDPTQAAAPARYSTDLHFCFAVLTATSTGITQPQYPNAANPAEAMFGGEGVETHRARIVAGPIQCPR